MAVNPHIREIPLPPAPPRRMPPPHSGPPPPVPQPGVTQYVVIAQGAPMQRQTFTDVDAALAFARGVLTTVPATTQADINVRRARGVLIEVIAPLGTPPPVPPPGTPSATAVFGGAEIG